MRLIVRTAVAQDGFGIATARVLAWQTAYRGLMPDALLDTFNIHEEGEKWRDRLELMPPDRRIFVAVRQDSPIDPYTNGVIGFCACGAQRENDPEYTGEIYALYVKPDCQGLGAGRAMVNAASAWLRKQGHLQMIIYVLRDNHSARGFYEAIGGTLARERLFDVRGSLLPEVGYGYALMK